MNDNSPSEADGRLYCPICEQAADAFEPFGLNPRLNARCPNCGSLERHRFVWLFFCRQTDLFTPPVKRFLHLAPERCLSRNLRMVPSLKYLSADIDAARAMVQMDITRIQFPDESFDVIYCSHVLEHVDDDRLAMRELYRVLAPGGWALFMVPILASRVTFEDPRITSPEDRLIAFGQCDHVRRYGPDFSSRLTESGFTVQPISPPEIISNSEAKRMAITRTNIIFFSRK